MAEQYLGQVQQQRMEQSLTPQMLQSLKILQAPILDLQTMIREEMEGQDVKEVRVGIHVGDTVEVSEGPMRGLKGIVNSIHSGQERVKILMEFLGRESLIEVEASKLLTDHTPRTVLAENQR